MKVYKVWSINKSWYDGSMSFSEEPKAEFLGSFNCESMESACTQARQTWPDTEYYRVVGEWTGWTGLDGNVGPNDRPFAVEFPREEK
jgi:hypothetical protein